MCIRDSDSNLAAAYFEVNNNDLLFDDLTDDDRLYKLIPFTTSAQSKPEIIRNLIKLFEDKVIKIPKNTDLIKELYDFKSKRMLSRVTFSLATPMESTMIW